MKDSKINIRNLDFPAFSFLTESLEIIEVNKAFLSLLQYEEEDILNKSISETALIENSEFLDQIFNRMSADFKPFHVDSFINSASGRKNYFRLLLSPVEKNNPSANCILANITDLHQKIEIISASKNKFQEIFNSYPDIYFETAPNGEFQLISPSISKFLNYSDEELINTNFKDLFFDKELFEKITHLLKKQGQVSDIPVEIYNKNGLASDYNLNAFFRRDEKGFPQKIIGSLHFRPETNAIDRKVSSINSEKSLALDTSSHAKLAAGISGMINQLIKPLVTETDSVFTEIKEMPRELSDYCNKTLGTLAQIESFLRLFKSISPLVCEPVEIININEELGNIFNIFVFLSNNKNKPLLKFNATSQIKADPARLRQLLFIFFRQAQHILNPKGKLIIEVTEKNTDAINYSELKIPLKDGLYSSISFRIIQQDNDLSFINYLNTAISSHNDPDVMGFSYAIKILKDHSASFSIEANETGEYSLNIFFPVFKEIPKYTNTTSTPDIDTDKTMQEEGQPAVILVAEDNEMVRKLACNTLSGSGYKVLESLTPDHAIQIATEEHVDLLLSDVIMPGLNGPELYLKIHKIKPEIKVLFMSAFSSDLITRAGFSESSTNFIQKPFTIAQLVDKVQIALHNRTSQ